MSINERLKIIIDTFEGGTVLKFAKKINAAHTTIAAMLPGHRESKPGYEVISKVLEAYPTINAGWLMTGEGPMVKDSGGMPAYNYTGKNNTATNSVNVGGQTATEGAEVIFLREQVKELKTELARCREQNEKLLERLLSK